jgi:hypothetical protein
MQVYRVEKHGEGPYKSRMGINGWAASHRPMWEGSTYPDSLYRYGFVSVASYRRWFYTSGPAADPWLPAVNGSADVLVLREQGFKLVEYRVAAKYVLRCRSGKQIAFAIDKAVVIKEHKL